MLSGDITVIQIRKKTRDKLKRLGVKGQSYDDVINMVLQEYEKD
jgi:hypothetical protein